MDIVPSGQIKGLKSVLNYAIQTKGLKLKLTPEERKNEKVELQSFLDSNYSGDKSNQRSVTGFVFNGAHIS